MGITDVSPGVSVVFSDGGGKGRRYRSGRNVEKMLRVYIIRVRIKCRYFSSGM